MIKIILLVVNAFMLVSCVTTPTVYLKTTSDNVYFFDKSKNISVSTAGQDSLYAKNMMDEVKQALEDQQYTVANSTDYKYILAIEMIANTSEITRYRTATTTNYATGQVGSNVISIRGNTYTTVPVRENVNFKGFALSLYDASENLAPIIIWQGTIVGESSAIINHERDAIRKLISNLGEAKEEYVMLTQNLKQSSAVNSIDRNLFESDYFSVTGTQINEMEGLYKGRTYSGYIKTKRVNTKQFNGYVQTYGLKKYDASTREAEELAEWALGLGAYTIFQDGVYTTAYTVGDIRSLDNRNLQKVFTLPLSVGDKSIVRIFEGALLEFVIVSQEDVVTPARSFNDCFVIKKTLQSGNKNGGSDFYWLCKKVGIVQQKLGTGRTDVLTNIEVYK